MLKKCNLNTIGTYTLGVCVCIRTSVSEEYLEGLVLMEISSREDGSDLT